jgi:hypothetical protein
VENAGGPGKQWSNGSGWGVGFYSLFCIAWWQRCKWEFPREEKCLLGHLSPFGTSCSPSFGPSDSRAQMIASSEHIIPPSLFIFLKYKQCWWLTPIILATLEQRSGGFWYKASLGK